MSSGQALITGGWQDALTHRWLDGGPSSKTPAHRRSHDGWVGSRDDAFENTDENKNRCQVGRMPQKLYRCSTQASHVSDERGWLLSGLPVARSAVRSQKAVSAHFESKQILPFGFVEARCASQTF